MSSDVDHLTQAAGSPPQPTPETTAPQGRSLQDLGAQCGTGGSLPRRDRYPVTLTDEQREDIALLVAAIREAAPAATTRALRRPTRWCRETGLHRRFAALLALDWRYLRRPRVSSLERLVVAVGLGPEAASILADNFPQAIAPEA